MLRAGRPTQRLYEEHFIINSTLLYRLGYRLTGGIAYVLARHGLEAEHYTCRRELKELARRSGKAASAARPSKQPWLPVVR
jgi:hypothetical protein